MDEETKSRSSSRLLIALAVVVVLAGLGYWGLSSVMSAIPTPDDLVEAIEPEPYEEIGPVVVTAIRDLARLTTIESVQYTIVEKGTDAGWLAWARGDSVRLFAVATIGAGVDLKQVTIRDISLGEDGVVELVLPSAEIQYVAVDSDATQILDRETGLFTKGDPQLESEARRVADEVLVEGALEAGLLTQAEDNARTVLTDFLLSLGYSDVIVSFNG
jgi:hypothetical protein